MKRLLLFFLGTAAIACQNQPTTEPEITTEVDSSAVVGKHPEWSGQSSIYEVNIRQHTPEGTFKAFRKKLPELKELGVEILWIMPVQPIGMENRKGRLGSYYSIQDYTAVNPEFGTLNEFASLVTAAHDLGMKVILDWVANHTSWDHVWMEEHPEWYTTKDGKIVAPVEDWSDVADLNYDAPGLRKEMLDAMKFWVKEADIDGFRCDVAMMVPMDFWNDARMSLDSLKPMFMLAEAEGPEFHDTAFDMTYGWELHHIMNDIAKGEKPLSALDDYRQKQDSLYDESDMHMYFITNHDENSWNGTISERLGENHKNFFVLTATFPNGMPLVYTGQEYGNDKRLAFFEKDTVSYADSALFAWYSDVIELKMQHPALGNADNEGDFVRYQTPEQDSLYAFSRTKNEIGLLVVLNFGNEDRAFALAPVNGGSKWRNALTGEPIKMTKANEIMVAGNDFVLIDMEK